MPCVFVLLVVVVVVVVVVVAGVVFLVSVWNYGHVVDVTIHLLSQEHWLQGKTLISFLVL